MPIGWFFASLPPLWGNQETTIDFWDLSKNSWNPKQPFINGCFNWMIPNLYIQNGCFTKHPFIDWLFGVPGSRVFFSFPRQTWSPSRSTISRGTLTVEVSNQRSVDRFNIGKGFFPRIFCFLFRFGLEESLEVSMKFPVGDFLTDCIMVDITMNFTTTIWENVVFGRFSQASFPSKSQSLVKICDFAERKTGLCLMVIIFYEL